MKAEIDRTDMVKHYVSSEVVNCYGSLEIAQVGDKYYWNLDDHSSESWYEIPKSLFLELEKHLNESRG